VVRVGVAQKRAHQALAGAFALQMFQQGKQGSLARIERDIGTNFIESPTIPELSSAPESDTVRTRPIG